MQYQDARRTLRLVDLSSSVVRIRYQGEDVYYVPQFDALNPALTVYQSFCALIHLQSIKHTSVSSSY